MWDWIYWIDIKYILGYNILKGNTQIYRMVFKVFMFDNANSKICFINDICRLWGVTYKSLCFHVELLCKKDYVQIQFIK